MFQRIARRHANDSDEPVVADTAGGDAPTERIEPVVPSVELPTTIQPAVPASEQPTTDQPSAPPPAMDLTTRMPLAQAPTQAQPVPAQPQQPAPAPAAAPADAATTESASRRPGFRARGRMRRRLRYLRRLRELQVRDLGGLVFDLRRFERKRDDLVAQKVDQIRACDDELRALESALDERRDLRDVREPGIGGTCPRCFAVFGSADKFCANCGAALGGAVQGPAQVPLVPPPPAPPPATPPAPGAAPGPQQ